MKKIVKHSLYLIPLLVVGFVVTVSMLYAADTTPQQDAMKYLQAGSNSAGFTEPPEDPRIIAAKVVKIFLGLVGSIFVYLFVYSGYLLLTSHGEEDKISKAKSTMFGAVSGIIVILLAYSITTLIGNKTQEIISGDYSGPQMYTPVDES